MLSLIPGPGPALPPVPVVAAGDVVHVPAPVHQPSGRILRPGHYTVVRVEGRRVVVRARLDCSPLDKRFRPSETPTGWHVPLCCEPQLVYVEPGDWTAYADGRGPVTIPDRPQIGGDGAAGPGSFSS